MKGLEGWELGVEGVRESKMGWEGRGTIGPRYNGTHYNKRLTPMLSIGKKDQTSLYRTPSSP